MKKLIILFLVEDLYAIQGFYAEKKGEREEMQDFHVVIDDFHKHIPDLHSSVWVIWIYRNLTTVFITHLTVQVHCCKKFKKQLKKNI